MYQYDAQVGILLNLPVLLMMLFLYINLWYVSSCVDDSLVSHSPMNGHSGVFHGGHFGLVLKTFEKGPTTLHGN